VTSLGVKRFERSGCRDVHVVLAERRLVENAGPARDRAAGGLDAVVDRPVREVDEVAAGDVLARDLANARPWREDGLGGVVDGQFPSVRLVNPPPERAMALQPRDELRLRQPDRPSKHFTRVRHDSTRLEHDPTGLPHQ
jgi:hypothetical protein